MSTLTVVEEILRASTAPMSVREIVERAGPALPTKSKTPDTVVARDLSMDIKKKGEESIFIRTSPGRYTMRQAVEATPVEANADAQATDVLSTSMRTERAGTKSAPRADTNDGRERVTLTTYKTTERTSWDLQKLVS